MEIDNLFKMKEEYIFVFCKLTLLFIYLAGFNERFMTSVEVFDITRGIWREFADACSRRTKFSAVQISEEQILVMGGKDEVSLTCI